MLLVQESRTDWWWTFKQKDSLMVRVLLLPHPPPSLSSMTSVSTFVITSKINWNKIINNFYFIERNILMLLMLLLLLRRAASVSSVPSLLQCSSAPVLQCESSINWFQLSTEHHQQQDSLCSACWHDGCWSRWEDNCTILSLTIILNTTPTSSSNDNYWVPLHLSYLISPACLSTMVLCSASHT